MKNKKKGFTLIEMLVVVALIGILLVIVIPSVRTIMNNQNKKKYDVYMDVVEQASTLYTEQNKGQLNNSDKTCFNVDYQTLVSDSLLTESEVKCDGNIIITRTANNNYESAYYLTCTDRNDNVIHTSEKIPSGCLGFNGKFFVEYGIYEDSNKTIAYDGKDYRKNAYLSITSTSPYSSPIDHFEYATADDSNWKEIASEVNLADIAGLKDYSGTVYIRAVDGDGNTSSSSEFPVRMDNTGPSFGTNVTGNYLEKMISVNSVVDKEVGTFPSDRYSFDAGATWQEGATKTYQVNGTVSVCVRDSLENRTCKSVTISGIDRQAPTIVATSSKVYITEGTSRAISSYFNITYSPLGGSVKCTVDNTSSLSFGLNTVTCTATGVNTLTATASIQIAHQYSATAHCSGGRTLSGGSCTYSYTNNENKCGCKTYNSCASSVCGVDSYNSCATSACGYKTCANSACGYNSCSNSACGAKTCQNAACGYNSCVNSSCSCAQYRCTLYKSCTLYTVVGYCKFNGSNTSTCFNKSGQTSPSNCNSTCASACKSGTNYSYSCTVPGAGTTGRQSGCGTETVYGSECNNANSKVCNTYNSCENSSCGAKTCQNAACGYNSCATSACGNKTCQTAACGNQTCTTSACGDLTCENSACGVKSYKTCSTSSCGCKTGNDCTVTENSYRYYQCERTGNNGTNGTLSGSTCSF